MSESVVFTCAVCLHLCQGAGSVCNEGLWERSPHTVQLSLCDKYASYCGLSSKGNCSFWTWVFHLLASGVQRTQLWVLSSGPRKIGVTETENRGMGESVDIALGGFHPLKFNTFNMVTHQFLKYCALRML